MSLQESLSNIAIWMMSGLVVGFGSTIYGALRAVYRWPLGFAHLMDWLSTALIGVYVFVLLFWTYWGSFRLWPILWMAAGYLLWVACASPMVYPPSYRLMRCQARWLNRCWRPMRRFLVTGVRWAIAMGNRWVVSSAKK